MNIDISDLKPLIRSILLSLGRRASEHEFMTEYYNMEGSSFRMVLSRFGLNFWQFMSRMPDVCRVSRFADEVFVERVSTEASSHMDHLTIEKNRRRKNVTMRIPHYRLVHWSLCSLRMLMLSYLSNSLDRYSTSIMTSIAVSTVIHIDRQLLVLQLLLRLSREDPESTYQRIRPAIIQCGAISLFVPRCQ